MSIRSSHVLISSLVSRVKGVSFLVFHGVPHYFSTLFVDTISPRAVSSMSSLNRYDPALAPVPIQTMGRYVTDINNGITINVLK